MAFEELKERQSVMWGSGPYERVSSTLDDLHDEMLRKLEPRDGERWLDVACGTGRLTERIARGGADVIGIDLAPVLIATAKRQAEEAGVAIEYRVGDCERLEFEDGSFDTVTSTVGIMFAPDHEATARELARVVRPAGRIGLANWTPEGGVGEMFRMMAPFQPAPPPSSPFDWGKEERVRELLGGGFELDFERHVSTFRIPNGEEYWQMMVESYGPTKTLASSLGDRREELHQAWVDFFEMRYRGAAGIEHDREWLLVHGVRR